MRQQTTPAIVLRRTDYGEADRIVTFLTPVGKLRAMVKGVRRSKSKMAGGIELFSESTITFIQTKGSLSRIVSTRLEEHWDGVIGDLQKMMFGYEAMKQLDKIIEDEAERDYYELLKHTLQSLAEVTIPLYITELWFYINLLKIQGHAPNLMQDSNDKTLTADNRYNFSSEKMCFDTDGSGRYLPEHIKLFRLCLAQPPSVLAQVKGLNEISHAIKEFIITLKLID